MSVTGWGRVCAGLAILSAAALAAGGRDEPAVQFRIERAGVVSINIYRPDGTLARRLVKAQRFPAGSHRISWDGRDENRTRVAAGQYAWRGLFHQGIALKLRGWVGSGAAAPWPVLDGRGGWGGDAGVPSAVTADSRLMYLGWSLAERGNAIVACDPKGQIQWAHRRAEGASGCEALAVDDGLLYVLGGLAGTDAEGGAVYRLDAKSGKPVPWENGKLDLKISSLWPAEATVKPDKADAMAVRHGHIYLTFTSSEFLAVLDAKTGAYLQTVVGAPPGQIDVVATKTDLPDAPGKLVDADFAVIALPGGVLGKVLFAHDPLWVVTSEMTPVERDVRINALTVIGDGAKFHRHAAFIGLGRPYHQIQARPLLDTERLTWTAGIAGGRPLLGPWQPDALRDIRGVALAADGNLWVAEGDAFPKRFSVWDTSGQQGRLVREFFGPPEKGAPGGAINPLDPALMVAQNCEWRIDAKTGRATCLGVISRDRIGCARFGIGENGHVYLVTAEEAGGASPIRIFERVGDGDYKLRARIYWTLEDGSEAVADAANTVFWADKNGDASEQPEERRTAPGVVRFAAPWTMQDLTLHGWVDRGEPHGLLCEVAAWTDCGAPQYNDPDPSGKLPRDASPVSPDRQFFLIPSGQMSSRIACVEAASGRRLWEYNLAEKAGFDPSVGSSARLPDPLNNVWVIASLDGTWRMLTQDGFELARFFSSDPKTIRWPKSANPGADMTNVSSEGAACGSLTQAADGKLYLQTGRSAYWNLEFSGLENVRALAGGQVAVPAAR